VTLQSGQLRAAGPHVAVHITFGKPRTPGAAAAAMRGGELGEAGEAGKASERRGAAWQPRRRGHAAHASWTRRQLERSTVSLGAIATASCVPPPRAQAALVNSSAFSRAMAVAGLGDRFEAQQAAAFREALNASVTRCEGRTYYLPCRPSVGSVHACAPCQGLTLHYLLLCMLVSHLTAHDHAMTLHTRCVCVAPRSVCHIRVRVKILGLIS
jgi:hypothetical protein